MAHEQTFRCSKCREKKPRDDFHEAKATDRRRPVTSRCRSCRSEVRFARRYDTVCAMCMLHRPLDKNQVCRGCNQESGLRQCQGPCGEILPLFLKFEDKRQICRDCWAKLRRVRRRARSSGG